MANYIDEEILCEAYSHLDVGVFHDKEKLDKLEREVTSFFRERAYFLFGENIEIRVEFEEGSLRTKITAIGSAAFLIAGLVTQYGSFRQGVDQLSKDSTLLAQSTNLEVIFRTRADYCSRVSVEKRKGIFGRTQDLILSLDAVKRQLSGDELPTNKASLEIFESGLVNLLEWDKKSDKLFAKLESSDASACIASGFLQELTSLPSQASWAGSLETTSFKYRVLESDPALTSEVTGAAARYSSIIKSIRKKMTERVQEASTQKS